MNYNRVIVIGGDHHNTLGVIRSLGERGLKSDALIVTTNNKSFVGKSKYLNSTHIVSNDSQITPYLLSRLTSLPSKPIVICCSDASSSEVDLHANELRPFFLIPGSIDQGRITSLMNKQRMASLAKECGLAMPKTTYPSELPVPDDEIILPCIIKPLVSKEGSKDSIRICNRAAEINETIKMIGIGKSQLQQYIDKQFEYQLIGCSTDNDVIIPGVSLILRPCKGSNTSFLHYRPLSNDFCNLDACKAFVRRTGYKGLFSLEFLRDKNGNDYFIEINFRNDGNAICVTAAGVNLPFIWYLSCLGKSYFGESNKVIKPTYVMPDMAELKLLFTRQINILQYFTDLFKTNRFMEYDRKDPKPFWHMIAQKISHK